MAKLMKAKEYAKHVQTDVKTVRRWMRNGLLKFIPPPKEHPHYARLIDSSRPRPKKKGAESANTDKPKVKSIANVTRQVDKQPANIPRQANKRTPNVASQPREKTADRPRKPAFEKQLQSFVPRQVDKRPANVASQPREKVAEQDNVQSALVILAMIAFIEPAIALFEWLFKKKPQQSESSYTKRANTYMLPNSLFQSNQETAYLPKRTLAEILFGKQSKK